ncbi:hypothetical protein [Streptacidiphilus sp. EB103A]|uniref:hypothetical protein n=1 Tax=Streptacidiphilus sp. EB103A TaxID=3156275 RepID=UPI0035172D08
MAPKKTNTGHQQQIARLLHKASQCGYQEALRRVAQAARKGLLPPVLDKAGREQAVAFLLAADPSLLEAPAAPMPLGALAPWAQRARSVLDTFTPLFTADLLAKDQDSKEHRAFVSYCEDSDGEDLDAAWLYLGAGCIGAYDQDRGRDAQQRRTSLDQLEQQIQEHWRGLVGAVDHNDGFTTAEEVFARDVWDLPTMTVLAGLPEASVPATMRAWARACGSVAAGDAGRALAAFERARGHRFSGDLAQIQVSTLLRALQSDFTLPDLVDYSSRYGQALADHHIAAAAGAAAATAGAADGQEG